MAYNNNGKRNNNSRRYNNKNRRNNNNNRRYNNIDETNISPQQRRNFQNKCDSFMVKAKDFLASGDRVEAEFNFQHAEHYYRMANLGLENQPKPKQDNDSENSSENNNEAEAKDNSPEKASKNEESKDEKSEAKPKPKKPAKKVAKKEEKELEAAEPTIAELPFMQSPGEEQTAS